MGRTGRYGGGPGVELGGLTNAEAQKFARDEEKRLKAMYTVVEVTITEDR